MALVYMLVNVNLFWNLTLDFNLNFLGKWIIAVGDSVDFAL